MPKPEMQLLRNDPGLQFPEVPVTPTKSYAYQIEASATALSSVSHPKGSQVGAGSHDGRYSRGREGKVSFKASLASDLSGLGQMSPLSGRR